MDAGREPDRAGDQAGTDLPHAAAFLLVEEAGAEDDIVVPLLHLLVECADVLGTVLTIAVKLHRIAVVVASRVLHSGLKTAREAEVRRQCDIVIVLLLTECDRAIGRAIRYDQIIHRKVLRLDVLDDPREVPGFVVRRDDK